MPAFRTPRGARLFAHDAGPQPSVNELPNPAKPEPNRIRSTHQTSAVGGTVEAAAERALPRAPRRGALVLRPDHRHRYVARGVLCKRDDGILVGAADPHLRVSAICRAASGPFARARGRV